MPRAAKIDDRFPKAPKEMTTSELDAAWREILNMHPKRTRRPDVAYWNQLAAIEHEIRKRGLCNE